MLVIPFFSGSSNSAERNLPFYFSRVQIVCRQRGPWRPYGRQAVSGIHISVGRPIASAGGSKVRRNLSWCRESRKDVWRYVRFFRMPPLSRIATSHCHHPPRRSCTAQNRRSRAGLKSFGVEPVSWSHAEVRDSKRIRKQLESDPACELHESRIVLLRSDPPELPIAE